MTLLSVAQITYNTSINQITDTTSFFTNHEYNAQLFQISKEATILAEQVNIMVNEIKNLHMKLKRDIKFLSHCSAFYHNQHHAEALTLKKRNKVYLLQKNIKTTRLSNKLNHVKIRPFKIIKNIKRTSYELGLHKGMQWKHSVFHVSLLEPASKEVLILTQVSDNYLMKQEERYEVKWILQHKDIDSKCHYLVKWKEYLESENTWESTKNLNECQCIMKNYHQWVDTLIKKGFRQSEAPLQKTAKQQKSQQKQQPQHVPYSSSTLQYSLSLDHQVDEVVSEADVSAFRDE